VPAAAVIPAPIAYIKVAAVDKLVVGHRSLCLWSAPLGFVLRLRTFYFCPSLCRWLFTGLSALAMAKHFCAVVVKRVRDLYFEKIRVFKAGLRLNTLAWNNGIGLWFYFVGF